MFCAVCPTVRPATGRGMGMQRPYRQVGVDAAEGLVSISTASLRGKRIDRQAEESRLSHGKLKAMPGRFDPAH